MKIPVIVFLSIATAFSAFTTFSYFHNFVALTAGRRDPPLGDHFILLLNSLLLSAPVILVFVVIWPVRALIVASSAHAAIFVSLLTITTITFRPGHGSFGDSVAPIILTVLWLILAVEFVMIFIALARSWEDRPGVASLSTFSCLTVPLVGGWALGVLAWSETLPTKVIEFAEAFAGSRSYCLEADGEPVDSRRDLVAWSMLAANRGGYSANFHALMVIGYETERTYANWSYRLGRFVPVSEDARANIHLDREVKCEPSEHFLLKL